MNREQEYMINCTEFEERLTDYLDKALDKQVNKAVAEHAMSCPLCHSLLNEVKGALSVCREISAPKMSMTKLEARILSKTTPEAAMKCDEFEGFLTDYLDGFLPANVFHRWERHAVLCSDCTDLPGMVVRSIAACYTYKTEELAVPAGLHERILKATIGTEEAAAVKASWGSQLVEWVRGFSFPLPVPQLAPVAMMALIAFMVFSQTVSADGTLTNVYQKGFELAEQTYNQGALAWKGTPTQAIRTGEPITGTTYVDQEDKK